MSDAVTDYVEVSLKKVMDSPAYQTAPAEERAEIEGKLREHLDNLVLETALVSLSPQQLDDLKSATSDQAQFEAKLTEYTAELPDLAQAIQDRLDRETETLIAAGQI